MDAAAATEPLLERGAELARIESALARSARRTRQVSGGRGPAGIGKTAVLAEARAAAAQGGMRVLRARGTELEREFAFGVVRQLFEPPLVEASEARACGSAARRRRSRGRAPRPSGRTLGDGPPASGIDPSFAVLHGLYWLCANLAAARPLCLVVDDAHWADAPSLRYLAFLLTRLEELDVALIVATRACEAGTDAELLTTLTTDPSADVIRLRPLTRAAVAELAGGTTRRGRPMPASSIPACGLPAACPSSYANSWRR